MYLDTGCSNHMCREMEFVSVLEEDFIDTVKFGDNSTVTIE